MPRRKKQQVALGQIIPLHWVVGMGIPILTFGGTVVMKAWHVADDIATRSDTSLLRADMSADFKRTDEAIAKAMEASKKYTDEKAVQVRDDAYAHSDSNKLKMESAYSDLQAKVSLMLQMLDRIDRNSPRK